MKINGSSEIQDTQFKRLRECATVLENAAKQEDALEELVDAYLIEKVKERIPSMKRSIKVDIDKV